MKRTKKLRLSALIVAALFLFTLFPVSFSAAEYSAEGATAAVFSENGVSVSGDGCSSDGSNITITKSGTYILSGSGTGSVTVDKGTTGVTIVLSGLTLKSEDSAAIICKKGTEVTVIAAAGTENFLSDTEKNNDENYPDNENAENAVIKCKDGSKVVLCGGGTLTVAASGKNGIKSGLSDDNGDASLTIKDLTLNVSATVNDAINAEQELNILSGNITVSAEDKGIHCDYVMNVGAENTDGPTIKVSESEEGLEAATVNIYSGNITVYSSDDCINAANKELSDYSFAINISGGKIWAYSSGGDGFDSNGTIDISDGNVTVWTANTADDQPLDSDGKITVSGGTVLAAGGSSGMGMNLSSSQGYLIFGNSGGMGGFGGGMQPNGGNMPTPPDMSGNSSDSIQNGNGGTQGSNNSVQGGNGGIQKPSDGNMTPPDGAQNGNNGTQGGNGTPTPPDMNGNSSDNTSGESNTGAALSDSGFAETAKGGNSGTQGGNNGVQGGNGGMQKPSDGNMTPPDGSSDGNAPALPDGATDGGAPTFPGGNGGQNAGVSKGETMSVTDYSGNTLFSEEAPCNVSFVFFSSSDIAENGEYSLLVNGSETLTATGSTGETASSFAPDGSRDFPKDGKGGFNVLYIIIPAAAFLVGGGISALVILLCMKKKNKAAKTEAHGTETGCVNEKPEETAAETGIEEEKSEDPAVNAGVAEEKPAVPASSEEKTEETSAGSAEDKPEVPVSPKDPPEIKGEENTAENITEEEPTSDNKE